MIEDNKVFEEAINFLNSLKPLEPLQWDENLAKSAKEHVDDIGPKGLLLYQSSDGKEPDDRIKKYGSYIDSLGENIDFGPSDAMGIIVSLTLDDGEEERTHRENMFKNDYHKVGIACGPHKTEFYMCVMDFAYDFIPLNYFQAKDIKIQPVTSHIDNNQFNDNITEIKNKLTSEKNKNEILNKKIAELEERNKNLEKKLSEEKNKNNHLMKEISELKNNLKNTLNNNINNVDITKALLEKDKIIKDLNDKIKRFPFVLNQGEKLISLIIYLPDQFQCSMICKNTEKFLKIEERLYEKFEKYSQTENYFIVNGRKINRFTSLEQNSI